MAAYLNVPTASGASTPADASFAVTASIDIRVILAPASWNTGVAQAIISQYVAAAGAGSRFWLGINAAGLLEYRFYNTGGVVTATCPLSFTAGSQHYLRVFHNLTAGTIDWQEGVGGSPSSFGTLTALQAQTTGLATTAQATTGTAPSVQIGTDADNKHMIGQHQLTRVLFNSAQKLSMDWTIRVPGTTGPWVDTNDATNTSLAETWTRIGTAAIAGVLQITPPAAALQPATVLGCGQARAEVWTRGGLARVIDLPNITSVEYNRVRSDTSLGSVQLDGMAIAADPGCCAVLNTVRPWKHELHIYRDDKRVWLGPINEILLDGPVLHIKARDMSAWLDRRFVHFKHQYGGAVANQGSEESTTIFRAISDDGFIVESTPLAGASQLFTSVGANGAAPLDLMQRTYTPAQFKAVGPEIRDMAKGALDWAVINRVGYLNYSLWRAVSPNPVTNPTFEVDASGWTGLTRDTGVFHSGAASGRTAAPPNVTGSITGLTVGQRYQLRCWLRGTSSALDAAQKSNNDGTVRVGTDESSVFSWYVYGQATGVNFDNRGRDAWIQIGVFFTATATTMPISISASGGPVDSHGIYFDDFEVWQQFPSFTLRDYSLAEPAKVALSGLDQVNRAIVANQQSGGDYAFYKEAPKPRWVLGSQVPPPPPGVPWTIVVNLLWNDLANHTVAAHTQWYVDVGGGDLRVFENFLAIVENDGDGESFGVTLQSVDLTQDQSDVLAGQAVTPVSGLSYFANGVVTVDASGGAGAFTALQIEYGLLEGLSTQPLSDAAGAQSSATQQAASLGGTPLLLDKIVLSPNAGVTMQQLVPGVLFTLRLDDPCFAVQADLVLQSVTVKTTPSGESVELGFEPAGF